MNNNYEDEEATFQKKQTEYNQTGDIQIIWSMYKIIYNCLRNQILKLNKHSLTEEQIYNLTIDGLIRIVNRYKKKQSYNYGSLKTLCYWGAYKEIHLNVERYKQDSFFEATLIDLETVDEEDFN